MIHRHLTVVLLCGLCACVLTGCPKSAYIEAYKNTPTALTIGAPILERGITLKSGQTAQLRFNGNYLKIKSEHGILNYPRNIPHSGEDGPYFDGTLRIQINPDGVIYALKTGETPPVSDFTEQPYGYPIAGFEAGNSLFAACLDELQKRARDIHLCHSGREYRNPARGCGEHGRSCRMALSPAWEQILTLQRHETLAAGVAARAFPRWRDCESIRFS